MRKPIHFLSYEVGIAANEEGCKYGPEKIRQLEFFSNNPTLDAHWDYIFSITGNSENKFTAVAGQCKKLAKRICELVKSRQQFLVLGGDHSSAIGTWSGAFEAIKNEGDLGLIWIDAHMDSHTKETTLSHNIHGMPLAVLLGYGDLYLTEIMDPTPKLKPSNICLIGVRSFESGEKNLLDQLNVKVFYIDEVKERGLDIVMKEALKIVTKETHKFGISLDLDSIDPIDAPGVGVPEPNGFMASELCKALIGIAHNTKLLGAEIVEYNPFHDIDDRTLKLIPELISAIV